MVERNGVGGEPPSASPPPRRWPRLRLSRTARVAVSGVAAVAATAVALTLLGSVSRGTAAPQPAPLAKNFALPALGHPGRRISLASYAGKPVIVNFFASWCSPCQRETPLIARFYAESRSRVTVIGVDVNDRASAALKFVRASKVTYPVAVDGSTAPTASAYGLAGLPQTFFLNSQHRIVKRVAGPVTLRELQAGLAKIDSKPK